MATFRAILSLFADKQLRLIAILQFIVMVAAGTALNGCASTSAPVAPNMPAVMEITDSEGTTTRVETKNGEMQVSTFKSGATPPRGYITTPTRLTHDTTDFSRASLGDTAAPSDFIVGK